MKIIMLGAPGAGKGTQAKMIAEKYGIPHVSTGDIFRANIKNGTELGKEAKQYMDQGLLVPDELTVKILLDRVAQEDCKNGYVLDGFPRTIPQAEVLDEALGKLGEEIDYAVDVDVPDENIVKRMSGRRACLKCGATYHVEHIPPKEEGICDSCGSELVLRDDDRPETVQNRLKVYHDQTQPLIEYYTGKGVLRTVDGTMDMQDVFRSIVEILGYEVPRHGDYNQDRRTDRADPGVLQTAGYGAQGAGGDDTPRHLHKGDRHQGGQPDQEDGGDSEFPPLQRISRQHLRVRER